jgi:2-polyprenyl-3-methyl-5-hydroxy-6-metoxy-1,4-benzoquinol methylase
MNIKQIQDNIVDSLFDEEELQVGSYTSATMRHDPKHMAFVLSRYKFVAKMLENREKVMEVGCGDGFGTVLVAQSTGGVYAVDWNENLVRDNTERLKFVDNLQFVHHDMNSKPAEDIKVSAIYSIDVIEHIDPANEDTFMNNMIQSYENKENAVMIIGTPNVTAAQYASPVSAEGHINLKSHDDLKALLQRHFHNVFMFGMNDEVVHTGYAPMCHYLWGIGAGLK